MDALLTKSGTLVILRRKQRALIWFQNSNIFSFLMNGHLVGLISKSILEVHLPLFE